MSSEVTPEQARVLELVRRHGYNATAFQTLDEGYRYAFVGDDACVAYVDTGRAWVVAGVPIAPPEGLAEVARAFVSKAASARRRVCFFATETRFLEACPELAALPLGEQPVWDPREWAEIVGAHRSLREQLRRARAKGVTVRAVQAIETERVAITRLARRWFASRQMAPMGFLVHVEPFRFAEHRRSFVAERDGEVIGFAGLIPVPARGGWFLEHVLRDPTAPNGTAELLVDAVMRWAAGESCGWLTMGLAPLAGDVSPALRVARKSTALLYDFEGLRAYRAKLRPELWTPLYLSYDARQSAVVTLYDVLVAFSRDGLVRFAWRSLLRGSNAVLRALTVLLLPWTALLASGSAERWFPAPWVKWAWVGFDVGLVLALVRAQRRPSLAWLTALAAVITGDALLTSIEALAWNVPRAHTLVDWTVLAVACAAPSLAALVLWGARRRLRIVS